MGTCNCKKGTPFTRSENSKIPVRFKTHIIPVSLGSDYKTDPYAPEDGAYQNTLVVYATNGNSYFYDSDGIYTKLGYTVKGIVYVSSLSDVSTAEENTLYITSSGYTYVNDGQWQQVGGQAVDSELSTTSENPVENKVITAAINDLEEEVEANAEDIAENEENIQSLTSQVEENAESIATNTTNITKNTTAISDLEALVAENAEDISENASAISELEALVTENTTNISENAANIESLTTELEDLAKVAYTGSYADLINTPTIDTELSETSENAVENKAVTAAINTNTAAIAANTEAIEEINSQITDLSSSVSEQADTISSLQSDLDALEESVSEDTSTISLLTSDINSLEEEVTTFSSKVDGIDDSLSSLEEQVNTNTTDIATNTSAIAALTTTAEANETSQTESVEKITNLEITLDSLATNVENATNDITTLTAQVETNTENIAINTEAIEELENLSSSIADDVSTNATNISELEAEVEENTANITTNTTNITTNTTSITTINETLENLATVAYTGSYSDLKNTPTIDTELSSTSENAVENKVIYAAIKDLVGTSFEIVEKLPDEGENSIIYLVDKDASDDENTYDEYVWIASTGSFENIGDTQIDMSSYYTSSEVDDLLAEKEDVDDIGDGTLTIKRNGSTVQTFTANSTTDVTADITVPTTLEDFTDTSDFALAADLAEVATSGDYEDLTNKPTIPTVNNNKITLTMDGSTAGYFYTNNSTAKTIALSSGTNTTYVTNTYTMSGLGRYYAICSTPAATTTKIASVTSSTFTLERGVEVIVYFTYRNTSSSPTLNVSSTGAKSIYCYGSTAPPTSYWHPYEAVHFVYNGSAWMITGGLADTIYYGKTKLTSIYTSDQGTSVALSGTGAYNLYSALSSVSTTGTTATVLYSSSSGSSSTITLSDTATNYDYIDIFFFNNNGYASSVRIDPSLNSKFCLCSSYTDTTMYYKERNGYISGKKLYFSSNTEALIPAYSSISKQNVHSSSSTYYATVYKVIGWNL